ncbi:uncharacterized protein LOC111085850 isoform X1 [Limulus polyphemus]|uniref:Uncharacterized protein LOC111085850 isoform X1 n=1 Tax=Limulus polyphemus TaxID=6850 RepID=A0ABM1SEJ4_LIMPO|nr:uncharacterized protein LOC111085850 isoform X1 [Limulus polyphemus]XP_022242056.1 uncharacterized protein LOC111085850 isoform X1 [Limulus polyphemus]
MAQNNRVSDLNQCRNISTRNASFVGQGPGFTSAVSRCSFKPENIGSNILIIVGLTLTLAGIAITVTGVYTEFTHPETRPIVLGIGPSLIGIGVFFLFLRLFFCHPRFFSCCKGLKGIKQWFSSKNVTNTGIMNIGAPLKTTSVKNFLHQEPTIVGGTSPLMNVDTRIKPSIRSTNKAGTSAKVNFLSTTEVKEIVTPNYSVDCQGRNVNEDEQFKSIFCRPTPGGKFDSVVSASRKQEVEAGSRSNAGINTTRSTSVDFINDFNNTVNTLKLK